MRAAAATQHILARQPPETDRDITMDPIDRPRSEPDKTPQPESSSKRNDGNTVRNYSLRRLHSVFAAEQMDLMSELPQTFGGLEQIPFSSTVTIQALMNEGDLHQVFLTSIAPGNSSHQRMSFLKSPEASTPSHSCRRRRVLRSSQCANLRSQAVSF